MKSRTAPFRASSQPADASPASALSGAINDPSPFFRHDVFVSNSQSDADWTWSWLLPRLKRCGPRQEDVWRYA